MLKVVLPQIGADRIAYRHVIAPQLASAEADRVDMLRFRTQRVTVGVGVLEVEDAVIAHNRTPAGADVTGQTRVADRVHVARPDVLTDLESWLHVHIVPAQGTAPGELRIDHRRRHRWGRARRTCIGMSTIEFRLCNRVATQQTIYKRLEKTLIVTHSQIVGGRKNLKFVAKVPAPRRAEPAGRAHERPCATFPCLVKHGLVRVIVDRPHVLHPAHVVDAVHAVPAFRGGSTLATPTMASLVTSAASSSSLRLSVPAGRSGRTRYRTSAVLSQMRISTSSPSSRPNSFNTPRGSITARERYGADLYHVGGSPNTGHG